MYVDLDDLERINIYKVEMSYTTYNPNEIVYVKGIGYGTLVDCGKFKNISLKSETGSHKRDSIIFDADMFNSQNDSNNSKKSEEKQQKKEVVSIKQVVVEAQSVQKKQECVRQSNIVSIRLENTQVMVYTEDTNITKTISLIVKSMFVRKFDQIIIDIDINKTLDSLKKIIFDRLGEPINNYINFRLFTTIPVLTDLNLSAFGSKSIIQTSLKDCQKIILSADYVFGFQELLEKDKHKLLLSNSSYSLSRLPEKPIKPVEQPKIAQTTQTQIQQKIIKQTTQTQQKIIKEIVNVQEKLKNNQEKAPQMANQMIALQVPKIQQQVKKIKQIAKQSPEQIMKQGPKQANKQVNKGLIKQVIGQGAKQGPKQVNKQVNKELIKQVPNDPIKQKLVNVKNHLIKPLDPKIQEKIAHAIKQSEKAKQKQQIKDKLLNLNQISIDNILFHQCRIEFSSGKHYCQFKMDKATAQDDIWICINSSQKLICAYLPLCGKIYHQSQFKDYGYIAKQQDIIGIMLNFDSNSNAKLTFYRNSVNCGQLPFVLKAPLTPGVGLGGESQITLDSKAQFPIDSYRTTK